MRIPVKNLLVFAALISLVWAGVCVAAAVSQGFKTTHTLITGSLVALDNSSAGTITDATSDNLNALLGIVVPPPDSLLQVVSGENQSQVAISGVAEALVSNINGDIKVGDKITASPIAGVGMKAVTSTRVVGVAEADFNDKSQSDRVQLKDRSGKTQNLAVGRIPVLVDVAYFVAGTGDERTVIPQFIQNLANYIAGKKVPAIRIIVSGVLLVLMLMIVSILVYGAVKSSIISIGRNPLSHKAVRGSLWQVIGMATGILLVTLVSVYLIISR